jgi:2-dehydropantoate 2-reductase
LQRLSAIEFRARIDANDGAERVMSVTKPIIVAGAGSIGCFVGGMLADAGRPVSLLARPRVIAEVEKNNGIRLTSIEGLDRLVASAKFLLSSDPLVLKTAGVVLVTVKSADTARIADLIARHAPPDAVVVSLQNGVGNVPVLRERLPGRRVLAGMVSFNVVALGDGRFHRASSGDIAIEQDELKTAAQLSVPGLPMHTTSNILGVQWGKLLVNLNNALNALSGLPLGEQLAQRPWRVLLADQMAEALKVMKAEGIKPVPTTSVPPGLTPYLLRMPDTLFELIMARTMKIDRKARSSMWEDLQRGGRTEVDFLQGVIVQLAERHALSVPLSRRVVALVKNAEAAGKRSPGLTPGQIRG